MKMTVVLLAGLCTLSADAAIKFSTSRPKKPRTVRIYHGTPGQEAYQGTTATSPQPAAVPQVRQPVSPDARQNAQAPQPSRGIDVARGSGEPVRSFMGVRFGARMDQAGMTDMGFIPMSPKYFMFSEAFPMCNRGMISGFRAEQRCSIASPEQARQMLMRIKADLEQRTGCPMTLSDRSHIRLTEYDYSGRFTDVRLSVLIGEDDRSAKFYIEINNNRWIRSLQ